VDQRSASLVLSKKVGRQERRDKRTTGLGAGFLTGAGGGGPSSGNSLPENPPFELKPPFEPDGNSLPKPLPFEIGPGGGPDGGESSSGYSVGGEAGLGFDTTSWRQDG
jgi:hypothetical protein